MAQGTPERVHEAERLAKLSGRGTVIWVVSKSGFEKRAERSLKSAGVWFSDAESFNRIRRLFGLPYSASHSPIERSDRKAEGKSCKGISEGEEAGFLEVRGRASET